MAGGKVSAVGRRWAGVSRSAPSTGRIGCGCGSWMRASATVTGGRISHCELREWRNECADGRRIRRSGPMVASVPSGGGPGLLACRAPGGQSPVGTSKDAFASQRKGSRARPPAGEGSTAARERGRDIGPARKHSKVEGARRPALVLIIGAGVECMRTIAGTQHPHRKKDTCEVWSRIPRLITAATPSRRCSKRRMQSSPATPAAGVRRLVCSSIDRGVHSRTPG